MHHQDKPLTRFGPQIRAAFLLVLLLGGLASTLPAAANNTPVEGTLTKSYPEDFESFASVPCTYGDTTCPLPSYASTNTAGSGSATVQSSGGGNPACPQPSRCLAVADTAAATFAWQMKNDGLGVNLSTSGQSITFQFSLATGLTVGQSYEVRLAGQSANATTQPQNTLGIICTGSLASTEACTVYVRGNGAAVTPTAAGSYTAPGIVTATIDLVNTVGTTPSARFTLNGGGLSYNATYTGNSAFTNTDLDRLTVASVSTTLPTGSLLLDSINWQGAPLPAPTVSGITPVRGPASGGTAFTVTGTGFKAGAQVVIGGAAATGESVTSATTITGTTAAHSAGVVSVVVTNPDGQSATLTNGFTYDPAPTPLITALTPNRGIVQGGTFVNVTGQNFRAGFDAAFDDVPAVSTVFVSSTLVQVQTPPHAAGAVVFELCNTDGQCDSTGFTYFEPEPGGGDPGPGSDPSPSEFIEDFEDEPFGTVTPDEDWYTINATDATLQVVSAGGGKRLRITPGATSPGFALNLTASVCPGSVSMDIYQTGSGNAVLVAQNYPGNFASLIGSGRATIWVQRSDTNVVNVIGSDTAGFDLGQGVVSGAVDAGDRRMTMTCVDGGPVVGTVTGQAAGQTDVAAVCAGSNNPYTGCHPSSGAGSLPTNMSFVRLPLGFGTVFEIDNLTVITGTNGDDGAGSVCIFCSAKGNDDFGFDYVEDVELGDGPRDSTATQEECTANSPEFILAVEIAPCYKFRGDADNFAYAAKSWTPGQKWVGSYFMIEAASEGQDSVFRSAFSSAAGAPNSTNKGNGKDTGQFAEHIEVRFLEVGNDWNIQFFHVSVSNGVTSRTPFGAAFVGDNPNSPTLYNFTVDTAAGIAYLKHSGFADDSGNLNMTDVFPNGVALPAVWDDREMLSHWFVGYATDTTFNNDATTRLDPGSGVSLSTCIYAFGVEAGQTPVPTGDAGRLPPEDSDGDGTPDPLDQDDDGDGTQDYQDPDHDQCQGVCDDDDGGGDDDGGFIGGPDGPCLLCGNDDQSSLGSANAIRAFRGFGFTLLTTIGLAVILGFIAGKQFSMALGVTGGILGILTGLVLSYFFGWFPLWLLILSLLICLGLGALAAWAMFRGR